MRQILTLCLQILLHAKTIEYTVYKLLINFIDQNKMKIKSILNN